MNATNSSTLNTLINLIELKIKKINDSITSNKEAMQKVTEYDKVIEKINSDNQCFSNNDVISKIYELIEDIPSDYIEKKKELSEKIKYLEIISNSIANGHYEEYTSDELSIIDEVIKIIEDFKNISSNERNIHQNNVIKSNEELEKCESLYDKLRNGENGVEHLDKYMPHILMLIENEPLSFKKNVLILVQYLSNCIHKNIMENMNKDEYSVMTDEEEQENQEAIDEELIRSIFNKYNFNYDFFNDSHKQVISRISLRRIEDVLQTISSYKEYEFIKNYEKTNDELKLFLIIRSTTKEILEFLIKDAKQRNVTVKDIFRVDGVYKRIPKTKEEENEATVRISTGDNEYVSGSYEYYRKNSTIFERLSSEYNEKNPGQKADFFKYVLKKYPEILANNSDKLEQNLILANQYGIKMFKFDINGNPVLCSPTMYNSYHFAELADNLIECDPALYNYIVDYPTILRDENMIKRTLYYKKTGRLEYTRTGKIKEVRRAADPFDLEDVINKDNLSQYVDKVPSELVEKIKNSIDKKTVYEIKEDDVLINMDNNENVSVINDSMYSINGVIVSRHKFRRIWHLISQNNNLCENCDKKDLLMYALSYESYYNDEQLSILEDFSNKFNFGGLKLWNI